MDTTWESLWFAVIQGLTEFLPVSSSGHLLAMKQLTDSALLTDLTLDIVLHAATLGAILVVFRRDFIRVLAGVWRGGAARKEFLLVGVGTLPAAVVGLGFRDRIEELPEIAPYLLPICWGVMGLALLGDRGRIRGHLPIGFRVAVWVGLWQSIALLPGISRSGVTILAALWCGVAREDAARYSFLIAAPLIAGATVLEIPDLVAGRGVGGNPGVLALAFAVAFLTGLVALRLLLRLLQGGRFHYFGIYLLGVSIAFTLWLRLGGGS